MNIDFVLKESDKVELYENKSLVRKIIADILKLSWEKAKNKLMDSFKYLIKFAKDKGIENDVLSIINNFTGKNYKKLDDLLKIHIKEDVLYENKWWDEAKNNFYGAISFYPLLQAFLELDKVIKNTGGANMKYVIIYALIWASIVSGKVLLNNMGKDEDDVGKAYKQMMGIE